MGLSLPVGRWHLPSLSSRHDRPRERTVTRGRLKDEFYGEFSDTFIKGKKYEMFIPAAQQMVDKGVVTFDDDVNYQFTCTAFIAGALWTNDVHYLTVKGELVPPEPHPEYGSPLPSHWAEYIRPATDD